MLSKKIFNYGIKQLQISFEEFKMTKDKAKLWYEHSKKLTDDIWNEKISNCLEGCRKIYPTLADVLDQQEYYIDKKELAELELRQTEKQWQDKKEKRDDYKYKPMPIKIKNFIHKVLNIPDRDKLKEDK